MSKRFFWVAGVFFVGTVLAGCTLFPQLTATQTGGQVQADINVTLSGSLAKGAGEIFLLTTADLPNPPTGGGGGVVQLHNAGAKLDGYVGQQITVTGQYSGTTLYVDKINVQ